MVSYQGSIIDQSAVTSQWLTRHVLYRSPSFIDSVYHTCSKISTKIAICSNAYLHFYTRTMPKRKVYDSSPAPSKLRPRPAVQLTLALRPVCFGELTFLKCSGFRSNEQYARTVPIFGGTILTRNASIPMLFICHILYLMRSQLTETYISAYFFTSTLRNMLCM